MTVAFPPAPNYNVSSIIKRPAAGLERRGMITLNHTETVSEKQRRQMSESFRLGAVLALTGGFLDAYTYVSRGGVFANAQTGNLVLLGVSIAEGKLVNAVRYLIPILAFSLGILLAEFIRDKFRASQALNLHWRQVILLIETAVVFLVCFMPQGRMDMMANISISFICAMQVQSFRKVRGNAFATTMCTGNLRSATDLFYQYKKTGDKVLAQKSLQYYGIILFFLFGSVAGLLLTNRYHQYAALPCCLLLLAAFGLMFVKEIE